MAKLQLLLLRWVIGLVIARPAVASLSSTIQRQHARDVRVDHGDSFSMGTGAQLAARIDTGIVVDQPIPDKVVRWTGQSSVPKTIQFLLAGAWITILGFLPLVYSFIDHKPMTKTQQIVGAVMMVTVFGGFWLFTNIILFQSPHFDTIRPLTIVECIYLMSQVITTVGYGDVTPAKPRGQLFVGLYVLGALFVIAMIISDLTSHIISVARTYNAKARMERDQDDTEAQLTLRQKALSNLLKPSKPSLEPLMKALLCFAFFDICWIFFFHYYPGEEKPWNDAIYMSVISLSTVGFGVFTPVTEGGMIFGAFWMLFGSVALVNVVSQFTTLMVELNEFERMNMQEEGNLLAECTGGCQEVSEVQFLKYGLMRRKLADTETIDEILEAFRGFQQKGGKVKSEDIHKYLEQTYADGKTQ